MDSQAMAFLSSKPMGVTTTRWPMPSSSQLPSLTSLFHVAVPMRYSDPCASLFSQNSYKSSNKSIMKVSGDDQSGRMMLASSNASYAAPLDATSSPGSTFMMRPLAEILRDLNKRVPDQVLKDRSGSGDHHKYIPWYVSSPLHAFFSSNTPWTLHGLSLSSNLITSKSQLLCMLFNLHRCTPWRGVRSATPFGGLALWILAVSFASVIVHGLDVLEVVTHARAVCILVARSQLLLMKKTGKLRSKKSAASKIGLQLV